jgi:hypothetical protein
MRASYDCLVYPTAEHFLHRPEAPALGRLLAYLVDRGWIDATTTNPYAVVADDTGKPGKRPLRRQTIESDVAALYAETPVFAVCADRNDESLDAFESETSPLLTPRYCAAVRLGVSDALYAVRADDETWPEHEVRCPGCQARATVGLDRKSRQHAAFYSLAMRDHLPERCPGCQTDLVPQRIALAVRDPGADEPRIERTPFFRFALLIFGPEKRRPDVPRVRLEPSLLPELAALLDVPLRSLETDA